MGLFDAIFGNKIKQGVEAEMQSFFQAFTAYSPVYTTFEGGLYEMELIRAVIHSFAKNCSKLKPEITGSAYRNLQNTLQYKPNPFMTTSQYLYRIATILEINNNAFIVPIEDDYGVTKGFYPILPSTCEVVDVKGVAYLRYTFENGKRAAIEYDKVGILTQFQYADDFFGSDNSALKTTMQVIHAQSQGIINSIKNSAVVRFLIKVGRAIKDEDVAKEKEQFIANNLGTENNGGAIVYSAKFEDVQPIDSKPVHISPTQIKEIRENVFNYFGTNENILQNKFSEDEWNAYYEGKIAPFALQLSQVTTTMLFTDKELSFGNEIKYNMNNIAYASNKTKREMSTTFFDRALMNQNMISDLWGWAHVEGGNKFYIRKEYSQIDKLHDNPDDDDNSIKEPEKPLGGEENA